MRRLCRPIFVGSLLSLAALLVPTAAFAYPITPNTLWSLVERADLIVLAEVTSVRELPPAKDDEVRWNSAVAVLEVRETWKGRSAAKVEVPYPAGLACPAPPLYLDKKTVLAFLHRAENGKEWETVALSYGTLYPDEDERGDFRDLVRRAMDLQRRRNLPEGVRVDWLVEAAARPGTRWHGLYELMPAFDRMHAFYDGSKERLTARYQLSEAQFERLAAAFVREPFADLTAPMMLAVLASHASPEVDHAAASVVEAGLAEETAPWWLEDVLFLTLARFKDPNPKQRLASLGTEEWERPRQDLTRILWRSAQQELGIPDVEPAGKKAREVWGVGETTPD